MSIDIFSGSAFNKPKTWIENRDKTIFEFEDGTLSSFSWTDDINSQKLVDAGLKSSTSTDPSAWSTHPTKIRVGEGITAIANTTFFNCNTLRSIIYPNNMLSIGSSVFQNCTNLRSIGIPSSVYSIGDSTFAGCSKIRMIDVDNRNPHFHSEGGMFFDDDIDTLIIGIGNGHVVLPDGISSVGDSAFADMDGLTSLLVPSNIKKISSRAFYYCANLKSIEFYEGVDEIGENSFVGVNIQSLELPDTLSTLSSRAFAECENLSSVTTGDGITTIMLSSFANCSSLKTIVIGGNITQIGLDTFNGCTSLTSIIFLGKTTAQVKSELTNYNQWGVDASVIHGELD